MANDQDSGNENKSSGGGSSASTNQTRYENSHQPTSQNKPPSTGNDIASQVGGVLSGDTDAVKHLYETAKESSGQMATDMLDQAKEKASSAIDNQKSNFAAGLGTVAGEIKQLGKNLGNSKEKNGVTDLTSKYGESLARQVEKFSNYVDQKDAGEILGDINNFARRNPALFIGGAFVLGLLATRLLKSSSPDEN